MSTAPSKPQAQSIILVLSQHDPDENPSQIDDWHYKQTTRISSTIPHTQALTAMRFKAADSRTPEWLAVYDVVSTDAVDTAQYPRLLGNTGEVNGPTAPRLPILQYQAYTLIRESVAKPYALPARYLLVVGWSIPAHLDEEYNRWYDDEHMTEVAWTPGWIRGRRYKLVESQDIGQKPGAPTCNYLILFEWEDDHYWQYIERKDHTPWTKRIMAAAGGVKVRRYELYGDSTVERLGSTN
ncbi:hypothetical protein P691DRAFT_705737 [Macrolepiota fuliginosa MF-IS2]|uniref:Uncharacterized protein n=1 Tax=Macrolepiota fuliginosa MF-IS2 TaxID=1400762 RepID=A0A9P6C138_9AGAR|nr:hypothetical protein P691DRAFT_705737 [Macrolepiota fuliginosa MF-IS2]